MCTNILMPCSRNCPDMLERLKTVYRLTKGAINVTLTISLIFNNILLNTAYTLIMSMVT